MSAGLKCEMGGWGSARYYSDADINVASAPYNSIGRNS